MKKVLKYLIAGIFFIGLSHSYTASSQCNSNEIKCKQINSDNFISDGQYYSTYLQEGNTKKFNLTLLGGNTYRIITCTETYPLNYTLKDIKGNILFDNKEHDLSNQWDFIVKNTIDCEFSIAFDESNKNASGCVTIQIGFKAIN